LFEMKLPAKTQVPLNQFFFRVFSKINIKIIIRNYSE
jgi:hypothetical protein